MGNSDTYSLVPTEGVGNSDTFSLVPTAGVGNSDTYSLVPTAGVGNSDTYGLVPTAGVGNSDTFSLAPYADVGNSDTHSLVHTVGVGNSDTYSLVPTTGVGNINIALSPVTLIALSPLQVWGTLTYVVPIDTYSVVPATMPALCIISMNKTLKRCLCCNARMVIQQPLRYNYFSAAMPTWEVGAIFTSRGQYSHHVDNTHTMWTIHPYQHKTLTVGGSEFHTLHKRANKRRKRCAIVKGLLKEHHTIRHQQCTRNACQR